MCDRGVPTFDIPGFRGALENLIGHLKSENDENRRFQVHMTVETMVGQMQQLRRLISSSCKGGRGTLTAVEQADLDIETLHEIESLVRRSEAAFLRGRQVDAVSMAQQGLQMWIYRTPPG